MDSHNPKDHRVHWLHYGITPRMTQWMTRSEAQELAKDLNRLDRFHRALVASHGEPTEEVRARQMVDERLHELEQRKAA